ncbi:unnamed protein product (macronuclear) [Paramecium tetraurelia]|uniref:Amidohydrolase-related domain-containing protein n=1 Tax=Paramecium tetraurelia TaxID=5888 RepID=A0DTW1_PARTE|nr:uncharacterized protein GSPATT00020161001 [Paramecium tetraurelia]CAK86478.1 unnamed protein product [Paramecium tetraurelia]|eukprot:XP_001453875.1 hypothetical protein (macronuclear) [Paramecium tetraurelia strain d4-2]
MKYSIQGRYILYKDQLINGYICIEDGLIKHILESYDEMIIQQYPIKYVYENQIIMAAAIDTNVSLSIWDHIEDFTKMAIIGGVSLIINKPFVFDMELSSQETYTSQIEQLNLKSQTDFIQMAKLQNYQDINGLLKLGAFCFDCHLVPSYSGTYCKDNEQIIQIIQNLPSKSCLFIHTQSALDKDLGITSPFRSKPFNERLVTSQLELVDTDGISGSCTSDDESIQNNDLGFRSQIDYLNESNSPIKEIVKKYKNSDENRVSYFDEQNDIPTSPKLQSNIFKYKSKQVTEQSQLSLISRAELITYQRTPKMEQNYKFPNEEELDNQLEQNKSDNNTVIENVQVIQEQESPLSLIKDQQESTRKNTPQMSIQSSDLSSPDSSSLKSLHRIRSRAQTTQGLLYRRQSKNGFSLVLHQVENKESQQMHFNFSESRPKQNNNNNRFNRDYLCFLAFRPATWEKLAINKVKKALRYQSKCNIILNGYSSSFALVEIKEMINNQIYSDISYPYLLLDSEDIQDGVTKYKSDPPIRQKYDKQLLQKAVLQNNWISSISSSHLYVNETFKFVEAGDFRRAVGGLCSLGCTYQALWTLLFCKKNQDPNFIKQVFQKKDLNNIRYKRMVEKLVQLQQLVSSGPAQYLNLQNRGSIDIGKVADLVIFDPLKAWKFNFDRINHQFAFSIDEHIFKNKLFLGSVDYVFIQGQLILSQNNQIITICNRKGQQIFI